jgi:gliding motility-associated-like protein
MAPEGNPSMTGSPLELMLPQGGVLFQDQSLGQVSSWQWDFGDGILSTDVQPSHQYAAPGMYYVTLTTTNEMGCSSTAIHGPIVIKVPDLFIPNVFSPNADGLNDVFLVDYKGSQAFKLDIYDRWGELLHSTRNKQAAWKGDNMKGFPVPEGVFFYDVTIGDKHYNGPVTLVR